MLRIAIIDDDASHSRAVARLLRASGMEALTYPSAEDYLEGRNGTEADCLVLDIQLGGMSGFDLHCRLTGAGSPPPIVFLTAHAEPETIARVVSTGCSYVRKTDPAQLLLEAIRQAIAAHALHPTPKGSITP